MFVISEEVSIAQQVNSKLLVSETAPHLLAANNFTFNFSASSSDISSSSVTCLTEVASS